jgi:hypothetical protein
VQPKEYLQPYLDALEEHGDKFPALLWASRSTQEARFEALTGICPMKERIVLDAGCGRADLLDWINRRGITPSKYIGIEAVETFRRAAWRKKHHNATILQGDFVADPRLLDQDADVIIFCGSLNTLGISDFYRTLTTAWKSAKRTLAFNFLSSPELAKAKYLTWHRVEDVVAHLRVFGGDIKQAEDYLEGDCAISLTKP